VGAERALSRALAGSCNVPLGGYAKISNGVLRLAGYVGAPDGTRHVSAVREGSIKNAGDMNAVEALGHALADELRAQGAGEILAALQSA
jgi:hydroxymethylbilane synthase